MKIKTVIEKIKAYHKPDAKIRPETTRDQVLYGNVNQDCTGIVTSCWASVEVINRAAKLGANLIIVHEALFWNHGDHTAWLEANNNTAYAEKKALLDEYNIVVWRDHDHIHSGIPLPDGTWADGIFYGFAKALGWEQYIEPNTSSLLTFKIPKMTAHDVANHVIDRLGLNGVRVLGDPNTEIERINVPFHILGDAKKEINQANTEGIDCFLTVELIDYTLSEYIRDASQLGLNKSIVAMGHFNLEEPGMKYVVQWLPDALGTNDIKATFVQSGDMYHYIVKHNEL